MNELRMRLLGFVAGNQGSWGPESLDRLRWQLRRAGLELTDAALNAQLDTARTKFESGSSQLFLCAGKPCQNFAACKVGETARRITGVAEGCAVTLTDCQGPCNHGPVATLRVGVRAMTFSSIRRESEIAALASFCDRASKAGTLLVDPGSALPLIHHEEDHGLDTGRLAPVLFLLGHHVGTGFSEAEGMRFIKEVRGAWEAGGRFLGLRMSATYGLGEDFKDTHSAYVMVGLNATTGGLESRGYTDGGEEIVYPMEVLPDGAITFPDRVPHTTGAIRAVKRLEPSESGYREVLELEYSAGRKSIYYEVIYKSSRHEMAVV